MFYKLHLIFLLPRKSCETAVSFQHFSASVSLKQDSCIFIGLGSELDPDFGAYFFCNWELLSCDGTLPYLVKKKEGKMSIGTICGEHEIACLCNSWDDNGQWGSGYPRVTTAALLILDNKENWMNRPAGDQTHSFFLNTVKIYRAWSKQSRSEFKSTDLSQMLA